MKRNLLYSILLTSLAFVGCSEEFLDPQRNTSVLTAEDLSGFSDINPALVEGTLEGIGSFMIQDFGVTGSRHYDFGQKGVDIWTDIVSGDMALSGSAYGWYNNTANLVSTVDFTREENNIIWEYYYKIVNLANTVIQTTGGNAGQPETAAARKIMGQAKASRAYAYYYLAQLFQNSYDPAQPILPYYDGELTETAKVPASQIYALVVSDLTEAVELLDGYARPDKSKIDKTIAQGLLAYVHAGGEYFGQFWTAMIVGFVLPFFMSILAVKSDNKVVLKVAATATLIGLYMAKDVWLKIPQLLPLS